MKVTHALNCERTRRGFPRRATTVASGSAAWAGIAQPAATPRRPADAAAVTSAAASAGGMWQPGADAAVRAGGEGHHGVVPQY